MLLVYCGGQGKDSKQSWRLLGLSKRNGSYSLHQGINVWILLADKYISILITQRFGTCPEDRDSVYHQLPLTSGP